MLAMHDGEARLLRFLLVEDDDDHAEIVFRSLRRERMANMIEHARDGIEALAVLRQQGKFSGTPLPDIVLLDLKLPKLGGHEVLVEIKRDKRLSCVPVVILTTSDAACDMTKAYAHNANSYLVKPLDAASFRKMIEDLRLYWGLWNRAPQTHPPLATP